MARAKKAAPREGLVAVLPNDGFFINGLPHVAQLAEPDVADKYVKSGAFRFAIEADLEGLELDPEPNDVPPHFRDPEPEADDEPAEESPAE